MACLSIPIDHRLLKIIKRLEVPSFNDESSHLDVLRIFGQEAKRDGRRIPSSERNHGSELAGPPTKGGVLVSLLRPPRNQTFDDGFTADLSTCRTTEAIRDLIYSATDGQMSVDNISTFDTLPYSPEGSDEYELIRQAELTFAEMVKAKSPDVVLCCYQGNSNNEFIRNLRSLGVGKVFDEPNLQISENWFTTRVNAFHPSYAVNYQRTYSCFRRLLLLEFVNAFSHLSIEWKEEQWMRNLRLHCVELCRKLSRESWHAATTNRWEEILAAIHKSFSCLNYFNFGVDCDSIQVCLVNSNLSWNCADASLFLNEVRETDECRVGHLLFKYFKNWCKDVCEPRKNSNISDLRGYFELQCLSEKTKISDHYTRELHRIFFSFLRDVNLSFWREESDTDSIRSTISAQRDAFQRFSMNLERSAGRKYQPSLSTQFQSMGINGYE